MLTVCFSPADPVGVVVPGVAVPRVLLTALVVGELGVDVEVVCLLPLLRVDVAIISAKQTLMFLYFDSLERRLLPSSVRSGCVVILIDGIIPVVEQIIVDIVKPPGADVQRRREVGVQTSETHRPWLLVKCI